MLNSREPLGTMRLYGPAAEACHLHRLPAQLQSNQVHSGHTRLPAVLGLCQVACLFSRTLADP